MLSCPEVKGSKDALIEHITDFTCFLLLLAQLVQLSHNRECARGLVESLLRVVHQVESLGELEVAQRVVDVGLVFNLGHDA